MEPDKYYLVPSALRLLIASLLSGSSVEPMPSLSTRCWVKNGPLGHLRSLPELALGVRFPAELPER